MSIVDSTRWARWLGLTHVRPRRAGKAGSPGDGAPALDRALFDVSFAVVDVETTGGSPDNAALTEIGVAKFRGGECIGTFQTLVNPRRRVPPLITALTGITDAMVARAPRARAVLPSFLEFVRGSVLVGHNVTFDLSFLDAALLDSGRDPLAGTTVDTLALARRLVGPEVPNCSLRTLAASLGLEHRPSHRALDDVRATADLLHVLIERAAGHGVFVLGDLVDLASRPALPSKRVSQISSAACCTPSF